MGKEDNAISVVSRVFLLRSNEDLECRVQKLAFKSRREMLNDLQQKHHVMEFADDQHGNSRQEKQFEYKFEIIMNWRDSGKQE